MVITRKTLLPAAALLLTACSGLGARGFDRNDITDVHVDDFQSTEMDHCRPSDVPLGNARAAEFFRRAKLVDARTLHDHYDYAPCFVEGTLKYRSAPCEWRIRTAATGSIRCGEQERLFACDDCDDLFVPKPPR
jgi:hypothetical protein